VKIYAHKCTGSPSEIGLALQWWKEEDEKNISLRLGISSIVFRVGIYLGDSKK